MTDHAKTEHVLITLFFLVLAFSVAVMLPNAGNGITGMATVNVGDFVKYEKDNTEVLGQICSDNKFYAGTDFTPPCSGSTFSPPTSAFSTEIPQDVELFVSAPEGYSNDGDGSLLQGADGNDYRTVQFSDLEKVISSDVVIEITEGTETYEGPLTAVAPPGDATTPTTSTGGTTSTALTSTKTATGATPKTYGVATLSEGNTFYFSASGTTISCTKNKDATAYCKQPDGKTYTGAIPNTISIKGKDGAFTLLGDAGNNYCNSCYQILKNKDGDITKILLPDASGKFTEITAPNKNGVLNDEFVQAVGNTMLLKDGDDIYVCDGASCGWYVNGDYRDLDSGARDINGKDYHFVNGKVYLVDESQQGTKLCETSNGETCTGTKRYLQVGASCGEGSGECVTGTSCVEERCLNAEDAKEFKRSRSDLRAILNEATKWAQYGTAWSNLFLGEDAWEEWRKGMDFFFEETFLGQIVSGNWEESFCHYNVDVNSGQTVIVKENKMGELGMHIEGEMLAPGVGVENYTAYYDILYKVSYFVRNTNDDTNRYNIVFYTADGQKLFYFQQAKEISAGGSARASGTNMLVDYSRNVYTEVCLVLEDGISDYFGNSASSVCNKISGYDGPVTPYGGNVGFGGVGGVGGTCTTPNCVNPSFGG